MTASDVLQLLSEMMDYLDNHSDVIDGPEGRPLPNEAMSLLGKCEEAYTAIEKAGGIANDLVHETAEGRTYWGHDG